MDTKKDDEVKKELLASKTSFSVILAIMAIAIFVGSAMLRSNVDGTAIVLLTSVMYAIAALMLICALYVLFLKLTEKLKAPETTPQFRKRVKIGVWIVTVLCFAIAIIIMKTV